MALEEVLGVAGVVVGVIPILIAGISPGCHDGGGQHPMQVSMLTLFHIMGNGDWPGQFPYSPAPGQSAAQITSEQELDMLKGQTEILEDELEGIRKRIKEIESSKTNKT